MNAVHIFSSAGDRQNAAGARHLHALLEFHAGDLTLGEPFSPLSNLVRPIVIQGPQIDDLTEGVPIDLDHADRLRSNGPNPWSYRTGTDESCATTCELLVQTRLKLEMQIYF
jgi:hypothetical protein